MTISVPIDPFESNALVADSVRYLIRKCNPCSHAVCYLLPKQVRPADTAAMCRYIGKNAFSIYAK